MVSPQTGRRQTTRSPRPRPRCTTRTCSPTPSAGETPAERICRRTRRRPLAARLALTNPPPSSRRTPRLQRTRPRLTTSGLTAYPRTPTLPHSGADAAILKQLSCDNEGIFYSVADNDNLADIMAAYYNILSPMVEPCQVTCATPPHADLSHVHARACAAMPR